MTTASMATWQGSGSELQRAVPETHVRSLEHVVPDWDRPDATYQRIAEAVRPLVGATYLGLCVVPLGRHRCRLRAMAGVDTFDRESEVVRAMEAVVREAFTTTSGGQLTFARNDPQLSVPQRRLLELQQAEGCHIYVLQQLDQRVGAWVLLVDWEDPTREAQIDPYLLSQTVAWVDMFRHAEPRWWSRWMKSCKRGLARPAVAALLGIAVIALLVPVRYRISVPCLVEPVTRRFVTVPYEGRLEQALVQPGDVVEKGQILALMDGHEIELQLSAVTADYQRASKQRDASLATHDTSTSQIAALEVERLELQRQLLLDRVRHLEIRSPVDGVIISGDPRKTEGARFTMGQTIFEVGPLDDMVLELEVPAEEIAHVRLRTDVSFRLESLPYQRFSGQLDAVHPRAESRDNQHVFVSEMKLLGGEGEFLPGMRGRAQIVGDRHRLGWILFHRVYERALFWLGW